MRHFPVTLSLVLSTVGCVLAQPGAPVKLNLRDAEALALKNHPQVLAAQHAVSAMNQRIDQTRAAYYPALAGDVTGSQGNPQARIGAGFLTDSRLFDRVGQGITLSQLITDSGRTPNLVASSRLQAGAAEQTAQATRYDVLVRVNQAYFGTLRAQALVKVAQETVAARQLLVDQVTALYNNKLRSELDVSFVDVNLSQAKLLLLQAQDQVQGAFAELTRALGSQQAATYQLEDEPLPPSPPREYGRPGGAGARQPAGTGQPANEPRRRLPVRARREGSVLSDRQPGGRRRLHPLYQPDYAAASDSPRIRRYCGECADSNPEWGIVQGSAARGALPGARSRPAAARRGGSHCARREDGVGQLQPSLTSVSMSPPNCCARPPWRWIWRRAATPSVFPTLWN